MGRDRVGQYFRSPGCVGQPIAGSLVLSLPLLLPPSAKSLSIPSAADPIGKQDCRGIKNSNFDRNDFEPWLRRPKGMRSVWVSDCIDVFRVAVALKSDPTDPKFWG